MLLMAITSRNRWQRTIGIGYWTTQRSQTYAKFLVEFPSSLDHLRSLLVLLIGRGTLGVIWAHFIPSFYS